jgi:biotin transport system substrate-specific component
MQVTAGTAPTLIDTIWPRQSGGLLRMVLLAVAGSILMALSARTQVPMWPVPMTMQTFAVLVIGMSFGWRLAGATLLLYLAEGAVGLPVFASGGGIAYFAGPTTGYLVGFLVAAMLVGWLGEKGWDRSVPLTFVAMFIGTGVIFALGVAWLSVFLDNFQAALVNGFSPFIVGAFVKIALAAAVLPLVWKFAIRKRGV